MQNTLRTTPLIGRAVLVALLAAPAVGAQGRWGDSDQRDSHGARETRGSRDDERRLFVWRGKVDDGMRIYVRGDNVQSRSTNGAIVRNRGRVFEDNALPRREGVVRVQLLEGRGRVFVVQQPNRSNDYTAILQVRDVQRGADQYRIAAFFDPDDSRWGDRGGVWGRDSNGGVWGDSNGDVGYGDRVLHWSGNVDGDLRISLWRGQVNYDVVSGERPQNVRSNIGGRQMTQRTGQLTVSLRQGRGIVTVVEQPSSYNNYTAVVRVLDSQSGYGFYDFDLVWR